MRISQVFRHCIYTMLVWLCYSYSFAAGHAVLNLCWCHISHLKGRPLEFHVVQGFFYLTSAEKVVKEIFSRIFPVRNRLCDKMWNVEILIRLIFYVEFSLREAWRESWHVNNMTRLYNKLHKKRMKTILSIPIFTFCDRMSSAKQSEVNIVFISE